jgi:hypothetical protein
MKTLSISLIAVAAACGLASAQTAYTTPVGYTTSTPLASSFNLFGLTVHQPTLAAGTLETVTSTTVTDDQINFGSLLVAGNTYILEIDDASSSADGGIAEIVSWSGTSLTTTPTNLTLIGASAGVKYKLRKASTIADVFGATNTAGLLAGTTTTADILWISNGGGTFNRYYYATAQPPFVTAGWKLIGGGDTNRANTPIVYTDGLLIQRRGLTSLNLVVTGEVKTGKALVAITGATFNHIGTVYPVGSTLGSSGLTAFVTQGTTSTADIVWVPDGASYKRYYFATAQPPFVTAGWKLIGGGDTNRANDSITSGIIIQRRGGSGNFITTPPSFYSNL